MKKIFLGLLCAMMATASLAVNLVPFSEGVSFSTKLSGSGSATFTIYGESAVSLSDSVSSGTHESAMSTVWMRPGKRYRANISGSGIAEYWLSFVVPSGYALYVQGSPVDLWHGAPAGGSFSDDLDIQLLPISENARMDAGVFGGIRLGKSVTWDVGLGGLRSGASAGRIAFKSLDLTNSPASRASLYYYAPPHTGQIMLIYEAPTYQVMRQIMTPQVFVTLVDDVSGGYWLKFYDPAVAAWTPSTWDYTLSGSATPWKTIRVESPAANELRITETEGTTTRVSHLKLASTPPIAAGGAVTTGGGYTIHTFYGNGTFTLSSPTNVEAVIVAGGGGGGAEHAGGGGAGGLAQIALPGLPAGAHAIVVGAGGPGNAGSWPYVGQPGGDSSAFGYTARGGGAGSGSGGTGGNGGSGGGSGYPDPTLGGSGISGQGYGGNISSTGSNVNGGGGGGAAGSGTGTNGGAAASTWAGVLAGGGGGGFAGGLGGGGGAGNGGSGSAPGGSAAANSGSGGGGGGNSTAPGGSGGSGLVAIRYISPGSVASGVYKWELQEGDGTTWLRTTTHTSTIPGTGERNEVVEVRTGGASGTVVKKTKFHYVTQPWGEEIAHIVADPDGVALTTTYDYYTTSTALGSYRKVKSIQEPTGKWTALVYYDDWDRRGQVMNRYGQWLDAPVTVTTTGSAGHIEGWTYTADFSGRHRIPAAYTRWVNGTQIAQQLTAPTLSQVFNGHSYTISVEDAYSSGSSYVRNTTELIDAVGTNNPDLFHQPFSVKRSDGAQSVFAYYGGSFNPITKVFTASGVWVCFKTVEFRGTSESSAGNLLNYYDSIDVKPVYLVPNKSTMEIVIRSAGGLILRTETHIYTGSGFALIGSEDFSYDVAGRLLQKIASNGATTDWHYTSGLMDYTVDAAGTRTDFSYDQLSRIYTVTKRAAASTAASLTPGYSYQAQGDIATSYFYDGVNNKIQTIVNGSGVNAPSLTSSAAFDLAGRMVTLTEPGGYTTSYSYGAGGRIVTTTMPGGATKTVESYPDGQIKSVTGSAQVPVYMDYAVITGGNRVGRTYAVSLASAQWEQTAVDWLGRKYEYDRPAYSSGTYYQELWHYNSAGQLARSSRTGSVDTLYVYDSLGTLFREGLDIDSNGSLQPEYSDRFKQYEWTVTSDGSNWWRRSVAKTFASFGSGVPTTLSRTEVQLTGLGAGGLQQRSVSYDIYSNATESTVTVDRSNKKALTSQNPPDSTVDITTVVYNGLGVESRDQAGNVTRFEFDQLGRTIKMIGPRTAGSGAGAPFGATTTYVTGTNQVLKVHDAAGYLQAEYAYDSAGRVATKTNANAKVARFSYNERGDLLRQWGDTEITVEYGYDSWGRRTTMATFRGGSGWNNASWPTSTAGAADVTTWAYQASTGLLISKTDADNKSTSYTYTQAGQIATRQWARSAGATPVQTSYSYSPATGDLTSIDYNDSTPDLTYTYDRLGRAATVTDVSGTRTFNYNLSGTLELKSEDLPSFFGSRRISYPIAVAGFVGRPTGLQLGSAASPAADQSVVYGYDTYGRFTSLAAAGSTFSYSYVANSNLLGGIAETASGWTQSRQYLVDRDLLDVIETKVGAVSAAKFDYQYDNIGRRTGVAKTGSVYARYGNGSQGLGTSWQYDDRSQVTAELTTLGGTATTLTGRVDAYAYDNFGNRASTAGTTHNGSASNYTTNSRNQYIQKTVPGVFDVAGAAASGATITVDGSSAGVVRHGEYFFKAHSISNSSAFYTTLSVSDGTSPVSLPAFVAGTPEAFAYDLDGNLTSDGRWDYTYDAENRLVAVQTHAALSPSPFPNAEARRVEFKYDYLGRRIQKTVRAGYNGSAFTSVLSDEKFIYNGWNAIAKLNALAGNSIVSAYYWGLDWSGSLQGAGGVGGLILSIDGGTGRAPIYDGNGNVMGMINLSTGAIDACYEYDAFGQTLRESGSYAASNPWRFSTKYADLEIGLVYYGLRYYSPSLGRFINRDPIEEQGGLNLYAFCFNNGINQWDVLGQNPDDWREVAQGLWVNFGGSPLGGGHVGIVAPDIGRAGLANPGGSAPIYSTDSPQTWSDRLDSSLANLAALNTASAAQRQAIDRHLVAVQNQVSNAIAQNRIVAPDMSAIPDSEQPETNWAPDTYITVGYGAGATGFLGQTGISLNAGGSIITNGRAGYLQVSVSVAVMRGLGGAAYVNSGPILGYGDAPELWFSTTESFHVEGGAGAGAVVSLSFDSDGHSYQVTPPTSLAYFRPRGGAGLAFYGAWGKNFQAQLTVPLPANPPSAPFPPSMAGWLPGGPPPLDIKVETPPPRNTTGSSSPQRPPSRTGGRDREN